MAKWEAKKTRRSKSEPRLRPRRTNRPEAIHRGALEAVLRAATRTAAEVVVHLAEGRHIDLVRVRPETLSGSILLRARPGNGRSSGEATPYVMLRAVVAGPLAESMLNASYKAVKPAARLSQLIRAGMTEDPDDDSDDKRSDLRQAVALAGRLYPGRPAAEQRAAVVASAEENVMDILCDNVHGCWRLIGTLLTGVLDGRTLRGEEVAEIVGPVVAMGPRGDGRE